ncbi:chemotaxis protein CheW [Alsobacter sp. SYSU M60028]|uniref:histidine kinase n=1 Tax=Alsobacter ponti TaxID=2962936 RepID=A0ABT1LIH6_9HYPH|nr:chemotaxis protein CheW [Alsobacter ponti]MCP8940931.1 chemotaxis protein CheW [Alsobacter ponti]
MDDILREFVTETSESIENVDRELVRLEQEPNNEQVLRHIFRLVHTIKGTCGFLGLSRLETLAHAAEDLMSRFREGAPVTSEAVTVILATIDRVKLILKGLEEAEREPEGSDEALVEALERLARGAAAGPPVIAVESPPAAAPEPPDPTARERPEPARAPPARRTDPVSRLPVTPGVQSVRVGLDALEGLMTMVSELVLTRNQLIDISRRSELTEFNAPLQRLSTVTAELQARVMKTRMQPISTAWQKLPRLARDLSAELGKDIELVMSGAETELDRQVLELIKDPLTHLIRNAADHGIETPLERMRVGKPGRGVIRVSAAHESGTISIEIADDGRGLDIPRIAALAVERELATAAEVETMSEAQIARFIFAPGFSTVREVSHVSGRGVGMDVVRTNIELIGGSVDVSWTPGAGSVFTLKIPLTLAILAALIIETGGQRFAIPQVVVVELVQPRNSSEHRLATINGQAVLLLRDMTLPVLRLSRLLGLPGEDRPVDDSFIVIMRVGKRSFGVIVDAVFHTEEIVVKPMSALLKGLTFFSGNTILGDGRVILILDPNGVAAAAGDAPAAAGRESGEADAALGPLRQERTAFLVFRAGDGEPRAVPLASVTRLEEFDASRIETLGGRRVVQYRGDLLPLVGLGPDGAVPASGVQPVLVFSERGRIAGLAVDEVVDIIEDHLDVRPVGQSPGVVGTAVIHGRATEIVDVAHYLPLACPDWFEPNEQSRASGARRVLLLESTPFFRGLLGPVLKAAGYDVVAMADGQEALELLESDRRFDALVLDVEAPGVGGFEIAEALLGDRRAPLPIIGLATRPSRETLDRAQRLGLFEFVAKFDREGLLAALADGLQAREAAA